jgi:hypothetical protein
MSIGTWTRPYTLITTSKGNPMPFRYTNLKTDNHGYITISTHAPLAHITKHRALLAHAAAVDGVDFSLHSKRISLTKIQFAHKQEFT